MERRFDDFEVEKAQRNLRSADYYRANAVRKQIQNTTEQLIWEITGVEDNTSSAALNIGDLLSSLSQVNSNVVPDVRIQLRQPTYDKVTVNLSTESERSVKVRLVDQSKWQIKNEKNRWKNVSFREALGHAVLGLELNSSLSEAA